MKNTIEIGFEYSAIFQSRIKCQTNWEELIFPSASGTPSSSNLTFNSFFSIFQLDKNDFGSLTRTKKKQIKQWHSGSFWDIKMLWNLHILYMYLLNISVRTFSLTLYYNTKWWYYDIMRFYSADSISSHAGTPRLLPIILWYSRGSGLWVQVVSC